MKNGKKPTRKQMDFIKRKGLNPDNWLVVKDTTEKMVLVHRHFDLNKKIIQKAEREKDELKPCPFCGGKAEVMNDDFFEVFDANAFWIKCTECGLTTGDSATEEEAIKAWNRRGTGGRKKNVR
jgi:Lar family restriction alleviation protein